MESSLNAVLLRGTLAGRPVFSHIGGGESYRTFPLEIKRLSGRSDIINIIAGETLLAETPVTGGDKLTVEGQLRSYNNRSGVGARLVITVLARRLYISSGDDENSVQASGILCRPPAFRRTPMGRRICDMMLAVNRRYGRSDYLPCIAWGDWAEQASALGVGDRLSLDGRIQSRNYIKNIDGVPHERTAYELSAMTLSIGQDTEAPD